MNHKPSALPFKAEESDETCVLRIWRSPLRPIQGAQVKNLQSKAYNSIQLWLLQLKQSSQPLV